MSNEHEGENKPKSAASQDNSPRPKSRVHQPQNQAQGRQDHKALRDPRAERDQPPSRSERMARMREGARRVAREISTPRKLGMVHPALIPGIGVERTQYVFGTNPKVLAVTGLLIVAVIAWAIAEPGSISSVGNMSLSWVIAHFGWLFNLLAIVVLGFMLLLGYGRAGGVRLGADDETPEFSTFSWVAMLFSAGMGIGLLFFGAYEPLVYFVAPPFGFDVEPSSVEAARTALAQTAFHWGPFAWGFYALVGGTIAYSAYRRGRPPLISAIFEPIFGVKGTRGNLGAAIDIFAIIVTLFGTAVSLGIGALQVARGIEIVTGLGALGNGLIVGLIVVLTGAFILSAVSGVAKGIRILSNTNMVVAGLLAIFVFVIGPTMFLLNFFPVAIVSFFSELGTMLVRNANQGASSAEFLSSWTTFYWAWWISWSPFVGMFIAKISRGRTIREFVTVVVILPAVVCFAWFVIFGGTAMSMDLQGLNISGSGSAEDMLFNVLNHLPLGLITSIVAMFSVLIFFVTSADSASIVMSSMTQRGAPEPSPKITIMWGVLMSLTAISLLLAGGENALSGLQSIMVVSALPFAFVVIGIMVAWVMDLRTDPFVMRYFYAEAAIAQGVRLGIAQYGDDFVFSSSAVARNEGAGAGVETDDPKLTEWYTDIVEDEAEILSAEDVRRTLRPGRIQPRGPERPDHIASGDEALAGRRSKDGPR